MKSAKYFFYLVVLMISIIAFGSLCTAQDFLQVGIDKIARKEYKSAIENLQKAVEKTPKSTKASFYLGEAYFMDNQFDNAEVSLKRAIDLDDENAQALKRYGDVLARKGLFRDAIKQYERAIKFEKRNPDFLLAMGKAMVEIDSIDKAVTTLSLAKEVDSKNAEIYVALGDAYMKMNVAPMAIDNYKQSVDLDSNSVDAHIRMGDVYMKLRMYKDGLNAYIRGVQKDSTNTKVLLKVSHLLFYNRYYPTAADFYSKYTNQIDTCYQAYWEYGTALIYIRPPQFSLSIKMLSNAVKLNNKPIEALRSLALAYFYSKDYKNVLKTYSDLSKIDSLNIEEYAKWARSSTIAKDTANAILLYKKIIEMDPNYDVYGELASIYQKKGMHKEAGEFFFKKAETDSSELRIKFYQYSGQLFNMAKEYDKAVVAFKDALNIKPDSIVFHYYLGSVYSSYPKNDSVKLAFEEYKKFIDGVGSKEREYKDKLEDVYSRMANYEFFTAKNSQKSLEYYQKALRYDERNATYLLMIAYCYTSLSQKDPNLKEEACKILDKCLKINPRNKDAQELKKKLNCWLYDK